MGRRAEDRSSRTSCSMYRSSFVLGGRAPGVASAPDGEAAAISEGRPWVEDVPEESVRVF